QAAESVCPAPPAVRDSAGKRPWGREGLPMGTRGWKWPALGLVCLALGLLGAHLAGEQHRYRLHTPQGTIRIGMTLEQVKSVLGKPDKEWFFCLRPTPWSRCEFNPWWEWKMAQGTVEIQSDSDGRVAAASFTPARGRPSTIPRPSLFEAARSWLTGKKECPRESRRPGEPPARPVPPPAPAPRGLVNVPLPRRHRGHHRLVSRPDRLAALPRPGDVRRRPGAPSPCCW